MVSRGKLVDWLDDLLEPERFMEAGDNLNGVLVEGADDVSRVALCVNTTFETIDAAVNQDAEFVVSHHGGWKDFDQDLLAEKKRRMQEHDLTWYIAHACLDAADEFGVAASLARKLGIDVEGAFAEYNDGEAGRYGSLQVPVDEFRERLSRIDDFEVVGGDLRDVERVGVIGGGGGNYPQFLREAADIGCDAVVVGNASFFGEIYAHEKGLTLVTLEETSSEKWGVYALGERLDDRFVDVETVRLDERNW
ncbi:MAG: Nif3-like dinuclear metal center hexameric protein [Candidatus Nanohaloarchaea archaeon]|nr:Nif3-like dinuclear metal center hexameric protein [Candidatus Nanohaloarchaea archaeon]